MAPPVRIQYPGARYHVINRGNRQRDVSAAFGATNAFLIALDEAAVPFGWQVHAFVVMRNHYPSPSQHRNRTSCREGINKADTRTQARPRNTGTEPRAGDARAAIYVRDAADSIPRSAGPWVAGSVQGPLIEDAPHLARVCDYIPLNPVRAGVVTADRVGE